MKWTLAKVVISVLLVVSYFAIPRYAFGGSCVDGAAYWVGHVLYPLSHANIFHLAANVVCLWMIPCGLHLATAYLLAVVCSFAPCFMDEATMGFSGVLFAIVGMSWGRVRRFRDMLWKNKWWIVLPIFVPHVNALLHIWCLLAGYAAGRIWQDKILPQWTKDWI